MSASGTSFSIVRMNGSGPSVIINGLNEPSDGGVNATHPLIDFGNSTGASAVVDGIAVSQTTENSANSTASCSAQIIDGSQVTYAPPLKWTTFATGGSPNGLNSSSGTSETPVAGEWYYADLFIPFTITCTGLIAGAPMGPNSGTDKWIAALWPYAGGSAIANSTTAGITVPGSSTTPVNFKLALTTPTVLPGPMAYRAGVQSNGTVAHIETFGNTVEGFATGEQAGTFGSISSLTSPATTYTANFGPMLKTY